MVEAPWRVVEADGSVTERDGVSLEPLAVGVQFLNGRFRVTGVSFEVG